MPEVIINGPEGRLECRYMPSSNPNAPTALILHPEPDRGGTMNNRVTFAKYKLLQERGFSVMRFNFRGVGRSQGTYDKGEGELSDAAAAMDWLQSQHPGSSDCWIAGFSFGSWIGMQLMMRRPEITGFLAVSPPAVTHDFAFLAPCCFLAAFCFFLFFVPFLLFLLFLLVFLVAVPEARLLLVVPPLPDALLLKGR